MVCVTVNVYARCGQNVTVVSYTVMECMQSICVLQSILLGTFLGTVNRTRTNIFFLKTNKTEDSERLFQRVRAEAESLS